MHLLRRRLSAAIYRIIFTTLIGFLFVGAADAMADTGHNLKIITLSSRPDTVSGGSVLVRVTLPPDVPANDVLVLLNSEDVTNAFRPEVGHSSLLGLLDGLTLGQNKLIVEALTKRNQVYRFASLDLTNYPITGPIFSGPHEQPFYCMTQSFKLPASTQTLGPALDSDCSIATRVDYVYRTTGGIFAPLPSLNAYPADLAYTTTTLGQTVPYIVRVATGTINRGIYETAVLHDPTKEQPPTPFNPPQAWNHRLVYTLGGGCVGGWYIQGASLGNGGILEDLLLRQGYGIAASTLNVYGNNCQDLLAAETIDMVKARFIENFGPVDFTIGYGCSGGTEAGHPIADEYPGLLNGLVMGCSFPEVIVGMINNITDADLIYHYLHNTTLSWTDAQIEAATGYPTVTTLATIGPPNAIRVKAQGGVCNAIIPKSTQYDAKTNPSGIRCDIYDHLVNVFGRDSKTGFARRPLDNVGVQYGLEALNAGAISLAQFLDLNKNIGGYDNDGNYVPTRTLGDLAAIRAAYRSGRVTYGGLGLKSTPIIDYRGYVDQPENGNEVHSRFHSFSMRQRLVDVNGSFANQIMLVEAGLPPNGLGLFSDKSPVLSHALSQMDEWLTNLGALPGAPDLRKIGHAKPSDLVDACFGYSSGGGEFEIAQLQVYQGNTTCNQLYPAFSSPRMVAGEPLANNVMKCRLKPIDLRDYKAVFTRSEENELRAIFPDGVCDYSVPGMGQQPTDGTWQFF